MTPRKSTDRVNQYHPEFFRWSKISNEVQGRTMNGRDRYDVTVVDPMWEGWTTPLSPFPKFHDFQTEDRHISL
jgi:hypothetical protein